MFTIPYETNAFLTNEQKLQILQTITVLSKLKLIRNRLGAILPSIQSWDKSLGEVQV